MPHRNHRGHREHRGSTKEMKYPFSLASLTSFKAFGFLPSFSSLCSLWFLCIFFFIQPFAIAQTPDSQSLQSIGDARLVDELVDRGLTSLLDRYFDTHRTPQAERDAVKSMIALKELSNTKLSNAERQ